MPTPAYPHDHSPEQESRRITIDGKDYVYPINCRGRGSRRCRACHPPRSRPGLCARRLPVGVQIVGPWLEDRTPLKLAELIEREFAVSCRRRCLMIDEWTPSLQAKRSNPESRKDWIASSLRSSQ